MFGWEIEKNLPKNGIIMDIFAGVNSPFKANHPILVPFERTGGGKLIIWT
jgi:hypothetical protein